MLFRDGCDTAESEGLISGAGGCMEAMEPWLKRCVLGAVGDLEGSDRNDVRKPGFGDLGDGESEVGEGTVELLVGESRTVFSARALMRLEMPDDTFAFFAIAIGSSRGDPGSERAVARVGRPSGIWIGERRVGFWGFSLS